MNALAVWLTANEAPAADPAALPPVLQRNANKRDFDARFALARHHLASQRFTEAMDELLEIIMRATRPGTTRRRADLSPSWSCDQTAGQVGGRCAKSGGIELAGKAVAVQSDR